MSSTSRSWFENVLTSFAAGEAFCFTLTGDVSGYMPAHTSYVTTRRYLLSACAGLNRSKGGRIVITYSAAAGIQFPLDGPEQTQRKEAVSFLSVPPQKQQNAALQSALAGIGPQATQADPFDSARDPGAALTVVGNLLRASQAKERIVVLIEFGDYLVPPADKATMPPSQRQTMVTLLSWAQDMALAQQNNIIIVTSPQIDDLHGDLRSSGSGWKHIAIPLPVRDERFAYLTWRSEQQALPLDGVTREEMANLTAGLNLRHLEDIVLLGIKEGSITRDLITSRKTEIIASEYSAIAEMVTPLPRGFADLGGMEHLIALARDEIIVPVKAGRVKEVPKGVALVGPPGTGKTYFVRALAQEIGFNAVALNAANILGGIVGESERNLKRFFEFARSLSPTLIFIDELDQSDMSRRGAGSGNPVASNLFNAMLQFLSDETLRGKVIVFVASNRPDLIDPAMLRPGRMDLIVPVLLPNDAARASIIAAQAMGQGYAIDAAAQEVIVAGSQQYSAADLAALVRKAGKLAARAGSEQIQEAQARTALRLVRSNTARTADFYTKLAILACSDAEFLPPEWQEVYGDQQLQDQVTELGDQLGLDTGRRARSV